MRFFPTSALAGAALCLTACSEVEATKETQERPVPTSAGEADRQERIESRRGTWSEMRSNDTGADSKDVEPGQQ